MDEEGLARRREAMEGKNSGAWGPAQPRKRFVSGAIKAYAARTTSASKGAVRDVSQAEK